MVGLSPTRSVSAASASLALCCTSPFHHRRCLPLRIPRHSVPGPTWPRVRSVLFANIWRFESPGDPTTPCSLTLTTALSPRGSSTGSSVGQVPKPGWHWIPPACQATAFASAGHPTVPPLECRSSSSAVLGDGLHRPFGGMCGSPDLSFELHDSVVFSAVCFSPWWRLCGAAAAAISAVCYNHGSRLYGERRPQPCCALSMC